MATCRWCAQGGIFRAVDRNGLCSNCARPVLLSIQSISRVVDESLRLARTGKTLSTRLSRWQIVIERAENLVEYEERGISTITPLPSQLIVAAKLELARAASEGLREEMRSAESKAGLAATAAARLNAIAKVVQLAEQVNREYGDVDGVEDAVDEIEKQARRRHREVQLENLVDAANKAKFKGQTRKAIDGYREVLYLLKNDEVPDDNQAAEIAALEELVAELERNRPGRE